MIKRKNNNEDGSIEKDIRLDAMIAALDNSS